MAARTFRKKKQQLSRVYTNVDNRVRARASYWKQRRRISLEKNMEIQSRGEKMRNASGQQQGENERRWKIKANRLHEHRKQNIG